MTNISTITSAGAAKELSIQDVQSAIINILEDLSDDKLLMEKSQGAMINILEDFADDKDLLENSQSAMLNILEDQTSEREVLERTQTAVLNILEDYGIEKEKVELANQELQEAKENLESRVQSRTAELSQINQELESFSYSVSHDLRAPLRAITGYCDVLQTDYAPNLDQEALEILDVIVRNANKMGQLIDDILEFSRLGRQEMRVQNINLDEMCSQIYADLMTADINRKATLVQKKMGYCHADKSMMGQLLTNLIGNALKYSATRENPIIETGRITNQEITNQEQQTFYVKDNGVGFDPTYVDKIFGVFQRLHKQNEFEGTGVGLAVAQRVILHHRGKIWAEGGVDKGAIFYFTLPNLKEHDHGSR